MERAEVEGLELEYELHGSGQPVVLLHWGIAASWGEPFEQEHALARFRLVRYHRAGFAGSGRREGAITFAEHAGHCAALMGRLGIERAHVVGHSSSASIALQLALDHPHTVATLVLMEPARPTPDTELQAGFVRDVVAPAIAHYRGGDAELAVDTFARGVFGDGYRDRLERGLPGGLEQAVADAPAFFEQELPALQAWSFTRGDAARIVCPVLSVAGEHTASTFPERLELLCSWLPHVERFELRSATHLLHVEQPRAMAERLADFFSQHPVTV